MVIEIAYFDRFVDEDYLTKITKCKVISKEPCFSSKIRLRKINNYFVTFHTDEFKSSNTDYSYGMFYILEVDDMDIFKLYHSYDLHIKEITVSTIKVNSVEDFMRNKYKILKKDVKTICFVANLNEKNKKHYKNRRTKVNFNKRLLLNFLKV